MNTKLRNILIILSLAFVVEGFRLATQSGLTGAAGSVQNDGYAVFGGILILLGGMGIGYVVARLRQK
jgi:hypothetical protein